MEKSKDTSNKIKTGSRTAPNTPKLPRRRAGNNFRRYSESSDTETDVEKNEEPHPLVSNSIQISSRKQHQNVKSNDQNASVKDNKENLTSIAQYTNEINKLSQNVDSVDKNKPINKDSSNVITEKPEKSPISKASEKPEKSPKNIRARRSSSPTNAIIVRRKSIKNISAMRLLSQ